VIGWTLKTNQGGKPARTARISTLLVRGSYFFFFAAFFAAFFLAAIGNFWRRAGIVRVVRRAELLNFSALRQRAFRFLSYAQRRTTQA
jgi:hypothetical protein